MSDSEEEIVLVLVLDDAQDTLDGIPQLHGHEGPDANWRRIARDNEAETSHMQRDGSGPSSQKVKVEESLEPLMKMTKILFLGQNYFNFANTKKIINNVTVL